MNPTVELLRMLGSPHEYIMFQITEDKLNMLYNASVANRLLFFFLYRFNIKLSKELATLYKNEQANYAKINHAIVHASKILTDANIEHAFFKTIRPYLSTTVDLDILVFGQIDNYIRSIENMKKNGYKLITIGPKSTTLLDKEANVRVDLYSEIAASYITYIDKETLSPYITTTKLSNGEDVKTLRPEADLACIIAHSVIKEQMYTLSEYYTFIYYLKQMDINNFVSLVKQNNITSATKTHASITALLHKVAHGTIPEKLQWIIESLSEDSFEITRLIRNDFRTPHKYHPLTVAKSLLEIANGKKCRDSIAMQVYHMLNPNFTQKFLTELLQHMRRETY